MNIVAGELPEDKKWRVLIMAPMGQSQGLSMQLALALAKANNGDVVAAVIIPEDNEYHRASARSTIEHLEAFSNGSRTLHPVVVTAEAMDQGLATIVKQANIDLILDDAADLLKYDLNKIPCPISVLRDTHSNEDGNPHKEIKRILVPTAGGPNTAHVLGLLLPLTREMEVTALYIAREEQGENEKALGLERLRQTITFADANDRIKTKLISAESITSGILQEASEHDLVIVGASRESSLDKMLFGNIPDTVVEKSQRPVMVVQQPPSRLSDMAGEVGFFLNRIVPRLSPKERGETYVRIRRNARASISFYILITLSAVIAALGLIVNSPAVVIGAMLVAPLMSPIVGIGMSMVLGDTRFLRLSLGAVLRGVGLAVLVGMMAGLLVRGEPLTLELQARTQPSLFDLGIALFSGLAGAYALSISSAAGALPGVAIAAALVPPLATVGVALVGGHYRESMGAMLLFTTNLIAISVATAFTFLVLGFRPSPSQKQRRAARTASARIAVVSLVFISGVLALTSYLLSEELRQADRIETVVREQMLEQAEAEVMSLDIESFENGHLVLDVVARSTEPLLYQQARDLQENIGTQLKDEGILDTIAMTFSVIRITELDPLVPPTPTPSPTPTLEPTAGPSPTVTPRPTNTPAPTDTPTPQPTATAEPTETPTPIPSPTATPEPPTATIISPFGLNLRSDPSTTSGVLAILDPETIVVLLEGLVTAEGQTWQEVDVNGRVGWVSAEYLSPN